MPAPTGLTSSPICLMVLQYAGKAWRIASTPCDVTDRDGRVYHFQGGMSPLDLVDEIAFLEPGEPESVSIEVILPADLSVLVGLGHDLAGSPVEISLWRSGDAWERRQVYYQGSAKDPSYGPAGAPVRFSVSNTEMADLTFAYPPRSWIISAETFDSYDPAVEGKPYPTILGRPGVYRFEGTDADGSGSPAYRVTMDAADFETLHSSAPAPTDGDYYLVASGAEDIHAEACWIHDRTDPLNSGACYVYRARDRLGQLIYVAGKGNSIPADGHICYASWDEDTTLAPGTTYKGGGLICRNRADTTMEGAGDILRWALSLTSLPVDWKRWGPAIAHLNRYRIACYWDESCHPWDWVRDNLLPILPLSIRWGPFGVYPVVWRHLARKEEALLELEDGRNCTFAGEVEFEGRDDIANRIALSYNLDPNTNSYRQTRTWHGGTPAVFTEASSLHLRTSLLTYGECSLELTTDMVCDDATADLILAWLAAAKAHPRRIIRISGDYSLGHIESGDIVTLTSSRLGLLDQVAHVRRAAWRNLSAVEIAVMVFRSTP